MSTVATPSASISISRTLTHHVKPGAIVPMRRVRRMSREDGRAIEMLGHAIDYLADEFALECVSVRERGKTGPNARVAAIELLMASNREIYLSCPEVPSFSERFSRTIRSLFRLERA
jgi:hypothetical protein